MKLIKLITLFIFLLFTSKSFCQNAEKISLIWKINPNDTLTYQTVLGELIKDSVSIEKSDSIINFPISDFKELQKIAMELNSNSKFETQLYLNNKNEKIIDIDVFMSNIEKENIWENIFENYENFENVSSNSKTKEKKKKKNAEENNMEEMLTLFNNFQQKDSLDSIPKITQNIVLRGRISTQGEILSTFYKNSQINLISILFELPKEMSIGEKHPLRINMIEMDHNFNCDSFYKYNTVYIDEIIENEDDTIAVLLYNIKEYVSGEFNTSLGSIFGLNSEEATYISVDYAAKAFFSIKQGKLIYYDGILEMNSNSSLLGKKTTSKFQLTQ